MGYYKEIATERLEAARLVRANCSECGGVGYVIVMDDELGEVLCRCDTCWWRDQDDKRA